MNPVINSYRKWTFKSLLIAVYLLFFVAHLNGRFYSVANFYVYGKTQKMGVARVNSVASPYHERVHLSLDKRYYYQQSIKADFEVYELPIMLDVIERPVFYPRFSEPIVAVFSSCRCLRGPPYRTQA